MNQDIIKEFLVSLGFSTDKKGAKNAELTLKNLQSVALNVTKKIQLASIAIQGFTTLIASNLDKVYFTSQRINSSVNNIGAIGYAFKQVGLDASVAHGAMESLNGFLQSSPYARNYLSKLGVNTTNNLGQLKDTSEILTDLLDRLAKMPTHQATQYAKIFGIDDKTLFASRNGLRQFTDEYREMLKITGHDADKAAQQSHRYMDRMRSFTSLLGMLRDKIGANLADNLTESLENLRLLILRNFPKIEKTLMSFLKGVIRAGEYLLRLYSRTFEIISDLIDYYNRLDSSHQRTLKILGAMALAVWALSSPLMIVAGLLAALALLYDDYKTFKEGGKSYFDWSFLDDLEYEMNIISHIFENWLSSLTLALETIATIFSYVKGIINYTKNQGNELNKGEDEIVHHRIVGSPDEFKDFVNKYREYSLNDVTLGADNVSNISAPSNSQSSFNVNQNNNVTINTTSDPKVISNTIENSFDRINERVIRQHRSIIE